MIVTSIQLKISSRRDIAVLQKESLPFRAERMSILGMVRRMLIECLSALRIAFRRKFCEGSG